MVKIMEKPINMDDVGGFSIFLETPICSKKKWIFAVIRKGGIHV